ncbi:MAG: hypothetical protein H0W50_05025 [Parachlamydiaceae bacterium]|nr:hypothetical protein [Parachlamydiaceae bacterium]
MPIDPSLESQVRKKIATQETEKDRFEKAVDKNIQDILKLQFFDDSHGPTSLTSPEVKRKKAELQLLGSVQNNSFNPLIIKALEILITEGKQYLNNEEFEAMVQNLQQVMENIDQLDLNLPLEQDLSRIIGVSIETLKAALNIAIKKYQEKQYPSALALFSLLAVLDSNDDDYWFRTGICAQECKNFDLAIKAYNTAANINPELVGARLFCAQCHLEHNQKGEAEAEYNYTKIINEKTPFEGEWLDIYNYVGTLITEKKKI